MVLDPKDRQLTGNGKEMWPWVNHLQSTLFYKHQGATWNGIFDVLSNNEEHFEVRACMTPANRAFLLVCPHCWASCRRNYGNSDKEAIRQEARQALTKFVLDTDAAEG